jgi:hypothetical protein
MPRNSPTLGFVPRKGLRAALFVVLVLLATAGRAAAASVTVTTTLDNGTGTCTPAVCTLRDAVADAAADTIVVPTGHYTLTGGQLMVTRPLTVQGAGAGSTVIDAGHNGRAFELAASFGSAGTTMTCVEITNGMGPSPGGGAIIDDAATPLTLSEVLIDHNAVSLGNVSGARYGGGAILDEGGTLTLTNSTVTQNTLSLTITSGVEDGGGGINSSGSFVATGSHIDANTMTLTGPPAETSNISGHGGGGLFLAAFKNNTLTNSTVNGNSVTVTSGGCCFNGGGMYVGGPGQFTTTLVDTTVNGNTLSVTGPSPTTSNNLHCCSGGGGIGISDGLIMIGGSISANTATLTTGDCCQGGGGAYIGGSYHQSALTDVALSENKLTVNGGGSDSGGGAILDEVNPTDPNTNALATRLTIDSSTIDSNQANFTGGTSASGGGGLHLSMDAANSITNSTISGNSTNASGAGGGGGGGVYADKVAGEPQSLTLANATIAGNSAPAGAGGGLLSSALAIRSENSLVALNSAATGAGCVGLGGAAFTSLGYNLSDSPGTCNFTAAGDQVVAGSSVGLGPLQDNGGPTLTRALAAGSPAINAGNPSGCQDAAGGALTIDQRGLLRPSGGRCDIGAFEFQQAGSTGPPAGGTVGPPAGGSTGPPAGGSTGPAPGGTVVHPSRAFAFSLQSDSAGDISATIVARGGGKVTAAATFTPTGSRTPVRFDSRSAATRTPGVVVIGLRPDTRAKSVLQNHERLAVSVVITFSPTVGSKERKQQSIGVTIPRPVKRAADKPALLLDVTGTTSVSIRLNAAIDEVVFSGLLNYTTATDYAGRRVAPALGELARQKCVDVFDAGKSLGPRPSGPHPGAKIWEQQSPGLLVNLSVGTTTFIGNGRWSRLMFPGDVGKPVTIAVGQVDPFDNYAGEKTVRFTFKQQAVQASCEAVSVTETYEGPQANHGG